MAQAAVSTAGWLNSSSTGEETQLLTVHALLPGAFMCTQQVQQHTADVAVMTRCQQCCGTSISQSCVASISQPISLFHLHMACVSLAPVFILQVN
jgi:hypothetical protein